MIAPAVALLSTLTASAAAIAPAAASLTAVSAVAAVPLTAVTALAASGWSALSALAVASSGAVPSAGPALPSAATALAAAVRTVPPESTQQALGYPSLFLLVLIGALVPVVPTGALVSSAAVVAVHQTAPLALAAVFVTASLAAFLGDATLYWLGRRGMRSKNGSRWLEAIRARAPEERLTQAQGKLAGHGVAVLVLSRLVPAGRIPVMLACLMADWPLCRFARGNLPACLAWAVTYQLIGILGGSLFPEPWEGVVAAVALTVLVSAAPSVWRRIRGTAGA